MLRSVGVDGEVVDYPAFVDRLFVRRSKNEDGLMHAAVGVAGESGELLDAMKKHWVYGQPLSRQDLVEELGDIGFYMRALLNVLFHDDKTEVKVDIDMDFVEKHRSDGYTICAISELFYAAGDLLNCASAIYLHRVAKDNAEVALGVIGRHIDKFIVALLGAHAFLGISIEESAAANVRKLRKRYPEGYTDKAAIVRADKLH